MIEFWVLVIGFSLIGIAFFIILLKISERKKQWAKCGMCGWSGELSDYFSVCPECGYYNWTDEEENEDKNT